MTPCISIDWLTVHVQMPCKDYEKLCLQGYRIEKMEYQTRHFRCVYEIFDIRRDERVATLAGNPHSEILSMDSGLLKFDNKYLYQQDFLSFVKKCLSAFQLNFRSISRLDIALDFLTFANGLKPDNFVRSFMSNKYLKKGRESRFNTTGKTKGKGLDYQTLKFGSETSDTTYYLYNKTRELDEVKMKDYIRDNWRANGWDEQQDVWRLEFSLKSSTKGVFNLDTGEEIMNFKDLNSLDNLDEIFRHHLHRHFSFVRNEKKSRKDRCKPVTLFSTGMSANTVKISLSDKKDAQRSDKIFARKLMQVHQELRGQDFELSMFSSHLMSNFVLSRGISDWSERRLNWVVDDSEALKRSAMQGAELLSVLLFDPLLSEVAKKRLKTKASIKSKNYNR